MKRPAPPTERKLLKILMFGIGALSLSVSGGPVRAATDSPAPTTQAATVPSSFQSGVKLAFGGTVRTYNIQRASSQPGSLRPLVLVFHGHGGSADQVLGMGGSVSPLSRLLDLGRRDNVVVVAPDGAIGSDGQRGWNDCRADATTNPSTDDVGFTAALVSYMVNSENIDPLRVYAVGMSNGAMFTIRLSLQSGSSFAGFASIAGALPAKSECKIQFTPRPMLFINGTADALVRFSGGSVAAGGSEAKNYQRGTTLPVPLSISETLKRNRTSTRATSTQFPDRDRADRSTARLDTYASKDAPVYALVIDGGGHVEPSIAYRVSRFYERIVGPQNHDLESSDLIWDLLRIGRVSS
jgi:polyhydroxybutyrate depolymerase